MEALVYEESPLADYIESREEPCVPVGLPKSPISSTFAPTGYATLRNRVRTFRQSAANIAKPQEEAFIEQFRYLIIASQVLDDQFRVHPVRVEAQATLSQAFTVTGASATAALSFLVVWALHSVLNLPSSSVHWSRYLLVALVCAASFAIILIFGRRRYSQHIRQNATNTLSSLLDESQTFDRKFSSALGLIQEVEIVSRGYEISHPLPPISRIEDQATALKCMRLRRTLSDALAAVTTQYVEVHNALHQYTSDEDLRQYHIIYDISLAEYSNAISRLNEASMETRESLKDLRFSFKIFSLARKVMLCDLLALPSQSFWRDTRQWLAVSSKLQGLVTETGLATRLLNDVLCEEETGAWGTEKGADPQPQSQLNDNTEAQPHPPTTPGRQQVKAQMRRLEGIANSVRALNAKMYLFRQQVDAAADGGGDSPPLASTLSRQYENLGVDIRGLLQEWEQGRKTMLPSLEHLNRYSRSSSGLRSPISPSPSLGGRTMVDDGPIDALRALNGDDNPRKLSDFGISDDEVFEAVALPRKRASVLLSREERVAKIQEDRRKRATMQEHADRTTSMLRELEMVIKHRPRGRTTSRIPSA